MNSRNIYFVGYMGVGKSTIARAYANRNNLIATDLDKIIEQQAAASIREIFEQKGEAAFRQIEQKALIDSFKLNNQVIATGGGTPIHFNNMDLMLQHGIVVYLYLNEGVLYYRLKEKKATRPLIANIDDEDLRDFIEKHISQRKPVYEKAHFKIDAYPSIREVCASINSKINLRFTAS